MRICDVEDCVDECETKRVGMSSYVTVVFDEVKSGGLSV